MGWLCSEFPGTLVPRAEGLVAPSMAKKQTRDLHHGTKMIYKLNEIPLDKWLFGDRLHSTFYRSCVQTCDRQFNNDLSLYLFSLFIGTTLKVSPKPTFTSSEQLDQNDSRKA
jgi:hypothetical protein